MNLSRTRVIAGVGLALLVGAGAATAQDARPTDYWMEAGARASGLDLDDDFIVGEPEDQTVCDLEGGTNLSGGGYIEDIDGDLIDESQWFVFGANHPDSAILPGTDSATCGALNEPCATPAQAWANAAVWTQTNPGAEPVVCVAGELFDVQLTMPISGLAVPKPKEPELFTSEQWDFEYSMDPAMMVGVDADGDGDYPPVDTDDLAAFVSLTDSNSTCASLFNCDGSYAWNMDDSDTGDYIEVAHLEFRDWGRFTKERGGFLRQRKGSEMISHIFVHDFSVVSLNEGQCLNSDAIFLNQFAGLRDFVAVEYVDLNDVLAYGLRGGFQGAHRRYRGWDLKLIAGGRPLNTNAAGDSCGNQKGQSYGLMRIWGLEDNDNFIEWIDNKIEFDRWENGNWERNSGNSAATGNGESGIGLCGLRSFHVVGNRMVNLAGGLPGMRVEDDVCAAHEPHFSGNWDFSRNSVVVDTYDTTKFNTDQFINTVAHPGSNIGTNALLNGTEGYIRVQDNEIDYSALGATDRLGSFFYWQQAADGEHTGAELEIVSNDIVGCFARAVGSLFWEFNVASPTATPDYVRFQGNTIHAPGACNVNNLLAAQWDLASSIADFSATNNSFSHCPISWDGVFYSSVDQPPGWSGGNNTCTNTVPTLGNYLTCPGPQVLTLDGNQLVTDTRTELACLSIVVTDYVVGTLGTDAGDVTMLSGESVRFGDGFSVENGAKLSVRVDTVLTQ